MRDLTFAEQQSVEIAKALGRQADLIIMDEPTSALSARESERLFDLMLDLKRRGVSIIYISHRLQEVFRLADTITVMRDGRHVATRPAAELDEGQLIAMMVGRSLETPARIARGHGRSDSRSARVDEGRAVSRRQLHAATRRDSGHGGIDGRRTHGCRRRHLRLGSRGPAARS